MKKCKTNRSLVKCIFLGLITLGIYDLAVAVRMGSDLNRVQKQLGIPGKRVMNYIGACFLSIITLGIPLFIWSIRVPNRVYLYADKTQVEKRGSCKAYFLISILLCWTLIAPLIVTSQLLKTMNNVCKWYNAQIEPQPMAAQPAPAQPAEQPQQLEAKEEPEEIEVLEAKEPEQPKEEPQEQPQPEEQPAPVEEQPTPVEEQPKEEPAEPAEQPKKEEKPAPAKKAEPVKKEPAKKPAPAKKAEPKKEEAKKEPAKKPSGGAAYHVSKRASDNKWQVFIAGSDKVIKLFNTKVEAEAWVNEKAESTGRTVLVHASKGKKKGKIQK